MVSHGTQFLSPHKGASVQWRCKKNLLLETGLLISDIHVMFMLCQNNKLKRLKDAGCRMQDAVHENQANVSALHGSEDTFSWSVMYCMFKVCF